MADYVWEIGTGDYMMIRDTGTLVEFWFQVSPGTFNNNQNYAYTVNGATASGDFAVSGGNWVRIGYSNVTTDQTVSFTIYDEGLGWPTSTRTAFINRASVPPAPDAVTFSGLTNVSVNAFFTSNGDGGSAIIEWQLAYGTSSTTAQVYIASDGSTAISGLTAGTTYYFWARGRNAKGWGPWSTRTQITTHRVPYAPTIPVASEVKQRSVRIQAAIASNGGSTILEYQIGYGKSSVSPEVMVTTDRDDTIANLDVAATYYFWVRARNAYGWGSWSPRLQVTLIAGARVNQNGTWKRAVPYVKVAGVWKLARPWVKTAGVWKETPT